MQNGCFTFIVVLFLLIGAGFALGQDGADAESLAVVGSRIDRGGTSYFHMKTDGAMKKMFQAVRNSFIGPDTDPKIVNNFDMVDRAIEAMGLYDIDAVGASVRRDGDYYLSKSYVHIPDGRKGLLRTYGGSPHASKTLRYAGADARIFGSADLNLLALVESIDSALMESGFYQGTSIWGLGQSIADGQIMKATGQPIRMRDLLQSMGNEYAFIFYMEAPEKIRAALDGGEPVEKVLPRHTGALIAIESKNDWLFKALVASALQAGLSKGEVTVEGVRKFRILLPQLEEYGLTPAAAWDGECVLIASHISVLNDALQMRQGGIGLAESVEFKAMNRDFPEKNNGVVFMSRTITEAMIDLFEVIMKMEDEDIDASQMPMIRKSLEKYVPESGYASVRVNMADGIYNMDRNGQETTVLEGNAGILMVPAAAAMVAAIAIPNMLESSTKHQTNVCLEAQAKMEGAVDNWALDEGKTTGDKPKREEIIGYDKYLREMPTCPVGGELEIPAVGEPARCPAGIHTEDNASAADDANPFMSNTQTPQPQDCTVNQNNIEVAVEMWAISNSKPKGAQPDWGDLLAPNGALISKPLCPNNGSYTIPPVGGKAKCSCGAEK